jgi:hypothetical protein
MTTTTCPKCDAPLREGAESCPACGLLFAKLHTEPRPPNVTSYPRWLTVASLFIGLLGPTVIAWGPDGDARPLQEGVYWPIGEFLFTPALIWALPQYLLYVAALRFGVRYAWRHLAHRVV